jgi:hypothetical protein
MTTVCPAEDRLVLVVDPEQPCLVIEEPALALEVDREEPLAIVVDADPLVIEVGLPGPPGPATEWSSLEW